MSGVTIGAGLARYIAGRSAIVTEVRAHADRAALIATAALAEHRKDGVATIEVVSGRVNSYVCLVDPAALSIEYGHAGFTRESDGQHVGPSEGLHILARAGDAA